MRSFRIGSAFGIPIRLDATFLLVLPIFAWLIGQQIGATVELINGLWGANLDGAPLSDGSMRWILGSAAALGLFTGVILHELGHSLVAMYYGFSIGSITLWIFGGIAQLTDQPEEWGQEFLIALAGPVVSIALGVLSYAVLVALPESLNAVRFIFGYLAITNFLLAVFNLLPGFPMDGGRVLRALLARTRPFARATQIAAEVGKLFAVLLGLFGFLAGNIFLIGIAFFIYIGASSEAQQTVMRAAFQGVIVRDIMTSAADVHAVPEDLSVADLLDRMFHQRHTGYPVMRDGNLVGMVTLGDARDVDPVERDAYRVADIMTTELKTIPAHGDAMDAFGAMQQHGVGRLLVIDANGEFAGLISRTDLMTALDIIRQSGAFRANRSDPSSTDLSTD